MKATLLISTAVLFCSGARAQNQQPAARQNYEQTAVEERIHELEARGGPAPTQNPLIDHGGPVLTASKTYAIYWGTPAAFPIDLQSGMSSLLSGFNGSTYLGIAQQYMRGSPLSSAYMATVSDTSAPPSRAPTTAAIGAEVCKLFAHPDPSTIYFVFTSNAPKINYCAWHDEATCNGVTFQVAYIPNQAQLAGCSPYTRTNLSCNSFSEGTVASADSVAHEFMEAVTDPHINAWYDKRGEEMADKCNFVYYSCVNLPGGNWQIQAEWSNALNACQQQ